MMVNRTMFRPNEKVRTPIKISIISTINTTILSAKRICEIKVATTSIKLLYSCCNIFYNNKLNLSTIFDLQITTNFDIAFCIGQVLTCPTII